MKYSGIGGQAVLEGVMMRNKNQYAVAVRKPDKDIEVKVTEFKSIAEKYSFAKLPLIRGIVNFVESLFIGMKALSFSSTFYEEEEKKTKTKTGKDNIWTALTVTFSIILAIGVFMILPYGLSLLFRSFIKSDLLLTALEGVIRLVILIAYMVGISFVPDIRRVYMYHGAEHKTINCVEEGFPLTVKNVRRMTRKHMRCGTSFIIDVIILSVILFMFIRVENLVLRLVYRVLLVPVIAAVAYEFLRIAGTSKNPIVKFFSIPGLWFQGLTTREPSDDMIEVAISSVEAVFDWESFLGKKEHSKNKKEEKKSGKKRKESQKTTQRIEPVVEKVSNESINTTEEKGTEEKGTKEESDTKKSENQEGEQVSLSNSEKQKQKLMKDKTKSRREGSKSIESFAVNEVEEEDDEILNALDRFFNSKRAEELKKTKGKS